MLSRRFDIVVGSGTKGQTYLSWVGNQLIELPVSIFHAGASMGKQPGLSIVSNII